MKPLTLLALAGLSLSLSSLVACASPGASEAEASSVDALSHQAASSCVELDDIGEAPASSFEGTLVIDNEFSHPTQGPTHPYILQLAQPRCVIDGPGGNRRLDTEVHLMPSDTVSLKAFVGKKIQVNDSTSFAAHTAWHARDLVVMTKSVILTSLPQECLAFKDLDAAPTSFAGKLVVDNSFSHPTQGLTHPYILQLASPRCVEGGEAVREIHLAPTEGVNLGSLVGQNVQVVDGEPFQAHTAWHARDVVVMTTTIVPTP